MLRLSILLLLTVNTCFAYDLCSSLFCAEYVKCQPVSNCDGPNEVIEKGGFCDCCDFCYLIVGVGEQCGPFPYVLGVPYPSKTKCAEPLVCLDGRCEFILDSSEDKKKKEKKKDEEEKEEEEERRRKKKEKKKEKKNRKKKEKKSDSTIVYV